MSVKKATKAEILYHDVMPCWRRAIFKRDGRLFDEFQDGPGAVTRHYELEPNAAAEVMTRYPQYIKDENLAALARSPRAAYQLVLAELL